MKFAYVALFLVGFVAFTQADSQVEDVYKKIIDFFEQISKKASEVTGIQTDFDRSKIDKIAKDSFIKAGEKIQELVKAFEKDGKVYSEEVKKNIDNLVKQFNETVKNLNSAEIQGKAQKVQEALQAAIKKISEQLNELAKSAGIAAPPTIQKHVTEIFDEINKAALKIQEKFQGIINEALKKQKQ